MDNLTASTPPPNIFANDGSFFDQFRRKMANQSKTSDLPQNPNCQKQRPGFRPKTACKPINLKASLKKQLKSDLAVRGTLETKPAVQELSNGTQDRSCTGNPISRFSKDWKPRARSPARSPERRSDKRKTRSPDRRRSRTPEKRRSKSPDRRRSKSLDRRRSRSSEKRRHSERSPGRERKCSFDKSPVREKKKSSDRSPEKRRSSSEKSSPTPDASEKSNGTDSASPTTTTTSDPTRKRKRKSRWGERPADVPTVQEPTKPVIAMINGVPVVVPTVADTPQEVTMKALSTLLKTKTQDPNKPRYEYDSDEETENGTWEHKQRAAEIESTITHVEQINALNEGKHHLGDFLPTEELERFMSRATAIKAGKTPPPFLPDNTDALTEDNIGFKMLQKAGWKEGTGLGASSSGIVQPIDRGMIKPGNAGLGATKPDEPLPGDDEFDVYRKRMMLAYKYRPNPMKNPRRAYY